MSGKSALQRRQTKASVNKTNTLLAEQNDETFSGPIPHPDHLRQYENIQSGFADRMLKMAEDDLKHTHFIQKGYYWLDAITSIAGLTIGGLVACGGIVGGIYLVIHDKEGRNIFSYRNFISLVGIFIYGTRHKNAYKGEN